MERPEPRAILSHQGADLGYAKLRLREACVPALPFSDLEPVIPPLNLFPPQNMEVRTSCPHGVAVKTGGDAFKVAGSQRGLQGLSPAASLALLGLCQMSAHTPGHIQSLPHAHLHAKLPALAGEPGPPSTLPGLCVVGERAGALELLTWAWPHGRVLPGLLPPPGRGWGWGKWALGTKGSHAF